MTVAASASPSILIRVDGHHKFGLGHFYRCLSVALAVREALRVEPVFAMLASSLETGIGDILANHSIGYRLVSTNDPYKEDFGATARLIAEKDALLIITDLLTPDASDRDLLDDTDLVFGSVPAYIESLKALGRPVVAFTDEPDRIRIRPDIVIHHSLHSDGADYNNVEGTRFCLGADYFPLCADFSPFLGRSKAVPQEARRVLILFGGGDPCQLTLRVASRTSELGGLMPTIVLGPAVKNRSALYAELSALKHQVLDRPASVADLIFGTDMAVTTGGNTCFELAAMGTPAITICARMRQHVNADFFQSNGTLINLGLASQVTDDNILAAVAALAFDPERRGKMTRAGPKAVDGRGVERIVRRIERLLWPAGLYSDDAVRPSLDTTD